MRPFARDIVWSVSASLATTVAAIAVTRVLAHALGPEEFGAFSVVRRGLSLVAEVSTIPLGLAIARDTARAEDSLARTRVFAAAVLVGVGLVLAGSTLGGHFRSGLALAVFGTDRYEPLVLGALVFYSGLVLFSILYATYRGLGQIPIANVWQVGVMAIGPAVALIFVGDGVAGVVTVMGIAYWAAAPALIWRLMTTRRRHWSGTVGAIRTLAQYAVPRIPTGFALGGLLAVGPFLAARVGSLGEAGYLAVGQALVGFVQAGTEAFGVVALPRFARLTLDRDRQFLRHQVAAILTFVLDVGIFLAVHMLLWTDLIVLLLLGPQYRAAVPVIAVMVPAALPWLAYSMFRSIIDGLEARAVNTRNLLLAAATTTGLSIASTGMGWSGIGLALAFTAGLYVLGIATVRHIWRLMQFRPGDLSVSAGLLLNAVAFGVALGARLLAESVVAPTALPGAALAIETALFGGLLFTAWRARVAWAVTLEGQLFGPLAPAKK